MEISNANTGNRNVDALAWYAQEFQRAGMDNESSGVSTLRHVFVLLFGLGMRESSGRYCEGRDRSARNTTAASAEAGLFQISYNATRAHPRHSRSSSNIWQIHRTLLMSLRKASDAQPRTWRTLDRAGEESFK